MSDSVLKLEKASIFQDKNLILNEVDVNVKKGEFVYLIGKTGSGKSSLLKTLYGDLELTQGKGQIVGFDLTDLKDKNIPFLRRKLGIVFQDFKLLNELTIENNMGFVLRATGWKDKTKIKQKIEEVLSKVNMQKKGHKFPYELSGGEQQRVAIARALLNDPELILADEPTGNLDPQTSIEVMEVLQDLNSKGNTILMATHDYGLLLKYPSKTLKCENNKVFEVVQRKD
ncbi:cell division transporter, ATP-binding protein FtsE [Formosa sp. Hel3_A1_48]|jgi:cell division transport system ATP-binding protein|uniref:cell division ATP-binding protein FtsE n=1 Tax=Formosa sp. Hel3_A1_48 TaxID=1336795 RepID=UPI00084E198D|nr:ATP-binding cassette domain-containing protein [Formosa sp. Hel3_A1_48]AOR25548.1 cell division transporter, ATP-binding protein FtsE [Formosa sp. Hel3_A1_48]MDC0950459.1 ATP-binding cassette domain-containing protein [Flavobacteriaceae bacterium]